MVPFRPQGSSPSPRRSSACSLAQHPRLLSNVSFLLSSAAEQESRLLLPTLQCFAPAGQIGDGFCQETGPAPNFFFLINTQHKAVISAGGTEKQRERSFGQGEPRAQENAILPLFAQRPHTRGLPYLHGKGEVLPRVNLETEDLMQ